MEHCKSCHETFNNTRAGDKHNVVEFNYTIAKDKKGKLYHFPSDENVPLPLVIVTENNQSMRCLTAAEMVAKGMNQEKNGAWNGGGNWSPKIYG